MILVATSTFSICITALLGDSVLELTDKNLYRALVDSVTHGLVGLFSWLVVLISSSNKSIIISGIFEVFLSGILASFIDVDHFIYNRSLDLKSALQLGENRPILHCTSLLLVTCALPYIYSQVAGVTWLARLCWLTLVSVLSHHIRDAARRGLWFYPLGSTNPLPKPVYLGLLAALPHAAYFSAGILDRRDLENFRNLAPHYNTAKVHIYGILLLLKSIICCLKLQKRCHSPIIAILEIKHNKLNSYVLLTIFKAYLKRYAHWNSEQLSLFEHFVVLNVKLF